MCAGTHLGQLWQDIVTATEGSGPDVTSLRISLWASLHQQDPGFRSQVRDALAGIRNLFVLSRRTLPVGVKGRPLFCLAHRTPSNVNNLLPVLREALRRGTVSGIVTGGDYRSELDEFVGVVPVVSIQDVVGCVKSGDLLRSLPRITACCKKISTSLADVRPDLKLSLARRRSKLLRGAIESVQAACAWQVLFDSWSPSCVVSTSDFWPVEHQLCLQAADRQIPSFVIQHGTMREFWWPFVASVYLLWGNAEFRQMQSFGAQAERLKIAGMPASDELFKFTHSMMERLGPARQSPVCLILSQTHGSGTESSVFRDFMAFLKETLPLLPAINWKVKLHPAENDGFYRQLGDPWFERLFFYPKRTSLKEAVADADVVLTIYSTGGLEAMMMDRPLIVAPATERVRTLAPWPDSGGGFYVSSPKEFCDRVSRLASYGSVRESQLAAQRTFLAEHFSEAGHSAERIVEYIERQTEKAG